MIPFNTQLLCYYLLLFIVFSFVGWVMEVSLKYIEFHRFINRGFLIGPYCPIYGAGAVLITSMVHFMAGQDASYFECFLISFFFCGALEYFVSWYLEKVFHARWWDYSHRPMNLEGRIWIGNLVLFGIGGIVISKWIAPLLFLVFDQIPFTALRILCVSILALLLVDSIVSHFIVSQVRKTGESMNGDNTEQISQEIRRILSNKSIFHRRLINAYPYMQARTKAIQQRIRDEKRNFRRLIQEQKKRFYREDKK